MRRLGRYRWGPPLVVELASFVVAFALFAAAGGTYAIVSGKTGRPIWWVLLPAAVVVAVVLPLVRPHLTAAVARLAHGPQAEGYRMMSDLMARMAATLEVDEVLPRLAETAARSLHSERGEVSVWLADGRQWRRTWTPALDDRAGAPGRAPDDTEPAPDGHQGRAPARPPGAHWARPKPSADRHRGARPGSAPALAGGGLDRPRETVPGTGETVPGPRFPGDAALGDGEGVTVEVQHQGDVVGELGVGLTGPELSAADRQALNDLAAPAGVALATVRLTVELRRRVAEVAEQTRQLQASRRRLVEARRHEQQRTWARLRARVIPRIEAIAGSLSALPTAAGSTKEAAPGTPPDPRTEIARHASDALEELREVARGIFPAVLADSGLAVALEGWAERRFPGLRVTSKGDLRPLHRQPAAEAALYYACTLAVEETAGAASTGRDRPPPVRLAAEEATASATLTLPTSLQEGTERAIRDRLEALGGTLTLRPATGAGNFSGPAILVATVPLSEP